MIDAPIKSNSSRKRPDILLEAAKDNIEYLIFHRNNEPEGEVIVYIDKEIDLEWEVDDEADKILNPIDDELGKITNGVALLEPIAHNWPKDLKLSTKRVLGEAVARVLQKDVAGADSALAHAKEFVKAKSQQVSRFWTLETCLLSGGFAMIFGAIEISLQRWFETALGHVPYLLSLCFWSGCVGALLFVILKIGGKTKVDSTAEQKLHYIEGVARIVAGGLAGIFIGAMIRLGLILSVFSRTGMETLAMCTGAIIAGASERFAAGIITGVEKTSTITGKEKSNGD